MNQALPPDDHQRTAIATDDAIAVVSAYGAFRVLLVLLAVWSFFAGFALLTQGLGALSFGSEDAAAERVIGAHMILLAPVYGLLAWRRAEYRLLIWVPYAAQLAIVVPSLWELLVGDHDIDGALLLVVSLIFLVLLVYVWWSSHPLGFFEPAEEADELEDEIDAFEQGAVDGDAATSRARRYRRTD